MPNPIPYKDLFDVDGLKLAVKELTIETDAYGAAATEDFKRINSVVSALKKELEGLSVTMSKPIKLMDDSGQVQVKEYATQISELTRQVKTQQAAIESMNKIMTEQKQVIMDAKVATAQYAEQLKAEQVETQKVRTEIASKTLALKELALNTKTATTAQVAANGSYAEAQKLLSSMGKEIKGAENGLKAMTPELAEKIAQYNKLNDELKEFDAKMGNFQRNVGNYKSGFAGLNNSISQIGRELPALGINLQTFFLAISNNLPIFADEVQKSKEAIKAMREEGQKVPGIFTQILKGVFSLQTLMSVGITLLVLYGSKLAALASELFKTKGAFDEGAESAKAYSEAFKSTDFKKAISDILSLTANIDLAKKGFIDKEVVLKQYNDTVGQTIGKVDSLDQAEQNIIAHGQDYIKMAFFKAAANAVLASGTEDLIEATKNVQEAEADSVKLSKEREQSLKDINAGEIRNGGTRTIMARQRLENIKKDNQEEIKEAKDNQSKITTGVTNLYEKLMKQANEFAMKFKSTGTNYIADDALKSIEQIKARIAELSAQPGSAIDGSPLDKRIDALRARLKGLNETAGKAAKEGLALLEEQLNKIAVQLQNAIINDYAKNQGKETENTKKLADAYAVLSNKIKDVQQAQKDQQEAAQKRIDYANRGKQPVLSASGTTPTDLAGGIADASSKAYLVKELSDTEDWLRQIQDAYAYANDQIFKSYKDRKITLAQYNQQIQVSQDSAAEDIFVQEKKAAEIRIKLAKANYGVSSKEFINAQKALGQLEETYNKESLSRDERLYAAKLKLQQETIAVLQKSANTISRLTGNSGLGALFGDISTDLVNGIGDGEKFQKVAELGMDAINAYTEFAINASNQRIDQLNKERDHDIGLAGNNAEAKAKIEEEYNKKIAAEKTKQAKIARAAAAIDIIINTAVAVSKVIGQTGIFGIGLAPIIAALGAIELGIVLAQPLPQYAKGRNGGDAEFAEVNERGPELIGQRGKWRLANRGMRGVTFLNKGDEVRTATDTKQMLANGMITADGQYVNNVSQSKAIYDQYIMASNRSSEIDYSRMAGAVADGVSGLPVSEHNYNERGYQQNLRIKNTRQLNINKRNRF